jgi:hypothetical protein
MTLNRRWAAVDAAKKSDQLPQGTVIGDIGEGVAGPHLPAAA